jgi:putative ABC transport system permease protein
MFKNYLKTAFRNLQKNKGFTAINILGLSVGLTTCLLIVYYVVDEWSYDRYNTKAARIYRVDLEIKYGGRDASYAEVEPPMGDALKNNFPEIEKVVRLRPAAYSFSGKFDVKKGNENIRENNIIFTESALFSVFTFPMIQGNPSTALNAPYTAVISESAARKYFNTTQVLGKVLTINDTTNYSITGIIKDIPKQSHFIYDLFLSSSTLPEFQDHNWNNGGWSTYVLVKPETNVKNLEDRIQELANKHSDPVVTKNGNFERHSLTPLLSIHLQSDREQELGHNGSIQYVYIFSSIALFILLIACVNFMNLSTARSANRAREVGVRKVLGSERKYLVAQFLTESIMVTFAATVIAVFLSRVSMPLFNQISGKDLVINLSSITWLLPSLIGVVLIIGFLAGFYPAFYLSGFQPIDVLKGKIAAGFKAGFLRSFLVVFQFSVSIFLIVGTLVIYNQLHYIHTKSLGYDRNQVLIINNVNGLGRQARILNQEIRQIPDVVNTTLSSYLPTGEDRNLTALFPDPDIDLKKAVLTEFWPVDENYINTLGIQIVMGRNFSNQMASDSSAIIVNQAYARLLGVKELLNKDIYRDSYGVQRFHIVGVIKDFHFNSLRENISPLVLTYGEDPGALSVKVKTTHLTALLGKIENKWKTMSPNQQFSYSFMDQDFDAAYRSEQRIGQLFVAFSALAILIACLGLFGLATYAAEQRNKEIGIRKVLGANISEIVGILSIDFIKLVFIAILISCPLAWMLMNKWLQGFAYRVNLDWWIFAIAGLAALFIAFITISFQSIKAALANPVISLRSE